jgi:2-oxoglutarate dehydrogenase E1 component
MTVEDLAMSMQRNQGSSFLYGGNAPYVEDQYEQYLADPTRVPPEWKEWFDALRATPAADGTTAQDVPHAPVVERFAALARKPAAARPSEAALMKFARKQVAVQSLVAAWRMVGARQANLDPLRWAPAARRPELAPAYYGLADADMETTFSGADSYFSDEDMKLGELVGALEQTYGGTLGVETMHLADAAQRRWWQMRLESTRGRASLPAPRKRRILDRLTAAEGLEKLLHTRFVGQTRFSLEGGESLVVLLDELVRGGAAQGVRHAVMGMAHRGRLNVLLNVAGKPAAELFDEFEGDADADLLAGDVKYHQGHEARIETDDGPVQVVLAFNPSHLEIVNPVVQGIARATADAHGLPRSAVLPIEIHGDAAVAGQGIVQETLNLSYTRGHGTGGTVHVVVNNQVGFTTSDPRDARSTFYSTDVTKMIEAPVLHVNGDDPEAVAFAAQLALEFRAEFARSVVIEIVCFRRHGHQEQDTPTMTQPLMYRAIAAHPGVRAVYARRLAAEGVVAGAQADAMVQDFRARLNAVHDESVRRRAAAPAVGRALPAPTAPVRDAAAAPALEQVRTLAERITQLPAGYALHPLVSKLLDARREMAAGQRPLDWGMAEHLAFASVLAAGSDVRLSGQDSERGTFGHRHAVLHDQDRAVRGEGTYLPLRHVGAAQGRFSVTNSTLSEAAVLAYEYGYSATRPGALVLWEAQYGDFANGAQVVVDQFIASGFAKWGQRSGVVMLLPHGQEGAGPEHASARLERYLQLCAQDNLRVAQPTTPAQMFHLLRSQAALAEPRPLVVMTPKSLLRHPAAVSSLADLARGAFAPVIGDAAIAAADGDGVERVILCSGKVYYELLAQRNRSGRKDVAIVRLEQLYPFPADPLAAELAGYPNARVVVWAQEEARNQGAWRTLEPELRGVAHPVPLQYAGPAPAASTAPGSPAGHAAWQAELVRSAFEN